MVFTTWAENGNEAEEFTGMEVNKLEVANQDELNSICEDISPKERDNIVKLLIIERDGLERQLIRCNIAIEKVTKLSYK
jgi:hypothetical protein